MTRFIVVLFLATIAVAIGVGRAFAATFKTIVIPSAVSQTVVGIDGSNIVGTYIDSSGNGHGFLYDGSTYRRLDDPSGYYTQANGISGHNVVGAYEARVGSSTTLHGFLFDGSSYHTIDHPNGVGYSLLTAISGNNMVGYYTDAAMVHHSFLYDGSTFKALDDPLAGNSESEGTLANGVSGNKVVGQYFDSAGQPHSFMYDGSTYTTLSYPGSGATYAYGIDGNNIVGWNFSSDPHIADSGFLYNGSAWTELDYPDAHILSTYAYGISGNNIVGDYQITTSSQALGFLATVPEPSTIVLLALGAGLLGARCRHRIRVREPICLAFQETVAVQVVLHPLLHRVLRIRE